MTARRIGLVFNYNLGYCREILRGVKRFAAARPEWVFLPVAPEPRAARSALRADLAGLIGFVHSKPLALALARLQRPVVNVCGVLDGLPFARVGVDDEQIGELAARHLLGRGLIHFAFLGQRNHAASLRREHGFRRTIESAGHRVASHYQRGLPQFEPGGRPWTLDDRFRRWALMLPRPLGVFAFYDMLGVRFAELCLQERLRVPEDVAIIGMDNDDLLCELARPSLTSIAVPAERIGYEAAQVLERLMKGSEVPGAPLLLPPVGVVSRQSSDLIAIDDPEVAGAMRFILANMTRPFRVRDVLAAVPASRRSLERKFRHVRGRGIAEEVLNIRLEYAKSLLMGSQLPMSAIAQRAGFSSGKQLAVVFRRELGTTPGAFRNRGAATEPG